MSSIEESVLIVGAGPTGLILAHELLRRNVPVRLIEKRKGPSHTTRAMTVHARSMEMFEHMGIAHRLEEVCLQCPGNIYHFPHLPESEQPRTDYRVLPTRFAFYYKINQNDFEQVLREHLFSQYSLKPEYRTELVGLSQDAGSVEARIMRPDGTVDTRRHSWVVGCDGVRSFVRGAAGIDFPGEEVAAMAMMDVELTDVNFDDHWMNYFFDEELFMNCTKLPGRCWRIYMSEPTGALVHADDARAAFQTVADRLGIGMKIGEPEWATAWAIRNNIADRYRNGRMLICGDASHVHSPSGGQGMNGCMQDAFNLGWKLAAVFKGLAADTVLDSYERERKPIGEQITEGAMATHEIVMGFGIAPEERLHYTQEPGWEARTIQLVSGLSHNYRDVALVPPVIHAVAGPRAGERAPDALLVREPRKRLYDVFRHPRFTLLVVPGADVDSHLSAGRALRDELERRYPSQVVACLVPQGNTRMSEHPDPDRATKATASPEGRGDDTGFDFDHRVCDETGEILARYGIGPEGRLILVRPDLYVGMSCVPEEAAAMLGYLEQWFRPVSGCAA